MNIGAMDSWFDTMRGADGYAGPVVHWWQNCLLYTGAGLDWRYEGIILGYLALYERWQDEAYLTKAIRAADDLTAGQLQNGNYRNSTFEANPYSMGTPHEAASDIGLLSLSRHLKQKGDARWEIYYETAWRNLELFYLNSLWDAAQGYFFEKPKIASFVPNKTATLVEALFLFAELSGREDIIQAFALPSLDMIIRHQVQEKGKFFGAIYQNSFDMKFVPKFFPYYIARCVAGLLKGYEFRQDERYLLAAKNAMDWIMRQVLDDGSFPQLIYGNGDVKLYPQWIAALGDMLRAARLLEKHGTQYEIDRSLNFLIAGLNENGSIRTAKGFASQIHQKRPDDMPDFRDLMPVCGWADKAFRYFAEYCETLELGNPQSEIRLDCLLRGEKAVFEESPNAITISQQGRVVYQWKKGDAWAVEAAPKHFWR